MTVILKNTVSIQFYRLNDLYKSLQDEASKIDQDILDLDILKLKKEKRRLEISHQVREIEAQILEDIEKYRK